MADILLDPLMLKNADGDTVNPATEETVNEIANAIQALRSVIGIAADFRATILSGVLTSVGTVTTITQFSGVPTIMIPSNTQNTAYVLTNMANITRA